MNIVLFDIETYGFDFSADKGFVLCVSYKTLGEKKVHTIRRDNLGKSMWDDKEVVKKAYDVLSTADMWVTHNGKRFDVRFLNTRLLKHKLPLLPELPHFDTCEVIWKKLKMRARLESTQKFLGLAEAKTPLNLETWMKASTGDRASMNEVVEHCEADVRVLEQAYERLKVIGFKHPNVALLIPDGDKRQCPICASTKVHKRGRHITRSRIHDRYQCQKCGAWSMGSPQKVKGIELR